MKNAPVTPDMDVKKEMIKATSGGIKMYVSTPETGKTALNRLKKSGIPALQSVPILVCAGNTCP